MVIRLTPDADAELAEARQWYAHQRADLDVEFMGYIETRFAWRELYIKLVFRRGTAA